MNDTAIVTLVAACAGVFSLAAYFLWVLVPAWTAYTRTWERLASAFLSLYVLLAFLGIGFAAGVGVLLLWDEFG